MRKFLVLAFLSFVVLSVSARTALSPNGNFKLKFSLIDGVPFYELSYKNRVVIKPSKMGFELHETEDLRSGFVADDYAESSFDETWQPVWGET